MTAEAPGAGPAPHDGAGPGDPTIIPRTGPAVWASAATGDGATFTRQIGRTTVTERWPLGRFAGVATFERPGEPERYDLALVTAHGFGVGLETVGEDDLIAVWRAHARRFDLPMTILSDGVGLVVIEKAPGLAHAKAHRRRRAAGTGGRRPRFLMRRKTARLPLAPTVHRAGAL
jgi:hypothetical protein